MDDGLLPHGVGLDIGQALVAHVAADLSDLLEGHGRDEALGLPRLGDLGVQLVDLLEGETLGLVDHQVDEGNADEAEGTPQEEHLGLQTSITRANVDKVGGGVGNSPVEQPIRGGSHGQRLGADLEREDLTSDDPSDRTLENLLASVDRNLVSFELTHEQAKKKM